MNTDTRRQHGFTLLELLLVILIISLLIGIVAPKLVGEADKASLVTARTQIKVLESAVIRYKLKHGVYPTQEQGLNALVKKPESDPIPKNWTRLLSKSSLPKDPWGRAYRYRYPGEKEDFDVYSLGKDEKSDDDDIGNWSTSKGDEDADGDQK